jgi:hypothetical protein
VRQKRNNGRGRGATLGRMLNDRSVTWPEQVADHAYVRRGRSTRVRRATRLLAPPRAIVAALAAGLALAATPAAASSGRSAPEQLSSSGEVADAPAAEANAAGVTVVAWYQISGDVLFARAAVRERGTHSSSRSGPPS